MYPEEVPEVVLLGGRTIHFAISVQYEYVEQIMKTTANTCIYTNMNDGIKELLLQK